MRASELMRGPCTSRRRSGKAPAGRVASSSSPLSDGARRWGLDVCDSHSFDKITKALHFKARRSRPLSHSTRKGDRCR